MAVQEYDDNNPEQGIAACEVHPESNQMTVWFKGSSTGYVRPYDPEFMKHFEAGVGATRYWTKHLR